MIPLWVQRMPAIWIAYAPGLDPRMPAGAVVLSVTDARSMVETGQVSLEVATAWALGADVEFADDALPVVESVAERLRLVLPEASRPYLVEIGSRFHVPQIASAISARLAPVPPLAELADEVAQPHPDGVPRLSPEGRLLRGLAGL